MGKRGPAPKPTELKIIEGNRGHRPIVDNQPKTPAGAPDEPDWSEIFPTPISDKTPPGSVLYEDELRVRADASEMWRRTIPQLEEAFLVRQSDYVTLVEFCACWARLRQAERLVSLTRGKEAVLVATRYRRALKDLITQLGLSPASRLRLAPAKEEGDDEGRAAMMRILS